MIALALIALAAQQPNPYLAQAKLFQQTGDYKQCLKRIEQAQKWESSKEEQLDIAIYGGLCDFALLKTKEAESEFKLALTIDPNAKLPAFSSPKAVALFESLRPAPAPAQAKPEPAPVKSEPEPVKIEPAPAPAPAAVVEAPPPAAKPSRVPLVPIIAGAFGLVALGAGIGLGVTASSVNTQATAANFQIDAYNMKQSADTLALAADVAYAVAAVAAIAAVILFFVTRGD